MQIGAAPRKRAKSTTFGHQHYAHGSLMQSILISSRGRQRIKSKLALGPAQLQKHKKKEQLLVQLRNRSHCFRKIKNSVLLRSLHFCLRCREPKLEAGHWWQGSKSGRRSTTQRQSSRRPPLLHSRNASTNKHRVTDSSKRMARGLAEYCEPARHTCNVKAKLNTVNPAGGHKQTSRRKETGVDRRQERGRVGLLPSIFLTTVQSIVHNKKKKKG